VLVTSVIAWATLPANARTAVALVVVVASAVAVDLVMPAVMAAVADVVVTSAAIARSVTSATKWVTLLVNARRMPIGVTDAMAQAILLVTAASRPMSRAATTVAELAIWLAIALSRALAVVPVAAVVAVEATAVVIAAVTAVTEVVCLVTIVIRAAISRVIARMVQSLATAVASWAILAESVIRMAAETRCFAPATTKNHLLTQANTPKAK